MNQIERYFTAEKNESVLFVLVGIVAMAMAGYYLFKIKLPFNIGMAFPLIAVSLIQIIVGTTVLLRSPKDLKRVSNMVQLQSNEIRTVEIPRMKKVMKNFVVYRWIEIVLFSLGIGLLIGSKSMSIGSGIGLGLAIQSGLMLILDLFAENRGKTYLAFLLSL